MIKDKIRIDINRIEAAIVANNPNEIEELYNELVGTYSSTIRNFEEGLDVTEVFPAWRKDFSTGEMIITPAEKYPQKYIKNLKIIKGKMELLLLDSKKDDNQSININVSNQNTNTNQNSATIDISISFDEVSKKIDSMEDVLDSETINEIHTKIDELRRIIETNEKRSEKWKKAKDIGKWIFDRSVDVGIALLPLFLNIK